IGERIIGASRPELWVGGAERAGRLDRRGVLCRSQPVPTPACVAPAASRRRADRKRCFPEALLSQMSKESQRAYGQSETPRARYAATGDRGGKPKRLAPIPGLRLDSSKGCCPPTRQFLRRSRERLSDRFLY